MVLDNDPKIDCSANYAGQPDHFERLWTAHRAAYISGDARPKDTSEENCPFCYCPKQNDEDALIVYRGQSCYVILNLYPYNPGHTLICPYRHEAEYIKLNRDETLEMAELTQQTIRVLQESVHPAGFNLGMNQGAVAGAGIAGHLHQHVVPRYRGDANFLPIIGQTKTVGQFLGDTRNQMAQMWQTYA